MDFIKAVGFPRSFWNIARTANLIDVVGMIQEGQLSMSDMSADLTDVYQMGGDVIVAPHGKILYLYRSETSADRPTAEQLLRALSKTKSINLELKTDVRPAGSAEDERSMDTKVVNDKRYMKKSCSIM